MQTCLSGKSVECETGKSLRQLGGRASSGNGVSTIDCSQRNGNQSYKSRKIISNRSAKGSSDGAGEGDAGEAGGAEEVVCSGWREDLSVLV